MHARILLKVKAAWKWKKPVSNYSHILHGCEWLQILQSGSRQQLQIFIMPCFGRWRMEKMQNSKTTTTKPKQTKQTTINPLNSNSTRLRSSLNYIFTSNLNTGLPDTLVSFSSFCFRECKWTDYTADIQQGSAELRSVSVLTCHYQ